MLFLCAPLQISSTAYNLFLLSQGPLSPPAGKCGSGGATTGGRGSASSSGTPPSGKSAASRALGRSPSTKPAPRPTLQQVQQAQQAEQALEDAAAAAAGEGAPSQPVQGPAGDQHVFVVPMGLAPRTHKQAAMTATAAGTANMLERGQLDVSAQPHWDGVLFVSGEQSRGSWLMPARAFFI